MDLRFIVEFKVLPTNLFKDPLFLVKSVFPLRGKGIKSIFDFAAKRFDLEHNYTEEDFDVEYFEYQEKQIVFKITMPKREVKEALCKYIFITFNMLNEDLDIGYYTLEYTYDDIFSQECTGKNCMLCKVERNGNHNNYGELNGSDEEILNKIYSLAFK